MKHKTNMGSSDHLKKEDIKKTKPAEVNKRPSLSYNKNANITNKVHDHKMTNSRSSTSISNKEKPEKTSRPEKEKSTLLKTTDDSMKTKAFKRASVSTEPEPARKARKQIVKSDSSFNTSINQSQKNSVVQHICTKSSEQEVKDKITYKSRVTKDNLSKTKKIVSDANSGTSSVRSETKRKQAAITYTEKTKVKDKKHTKATTGNSSLLLNHEVANKPKSIPKPVDLSDPMAMLMMIEGATGQTNATLDGAKPPTPSSFNSQLKKQKASHPKTSTPSIANVPKPKKRLHADAFKSSKLKKAADDSGSEEHSDWEEVDEHPTAEKSQVPDKPVEITLDIPDVFRHKKKKKKEFDWVGELQRRVKRFKKEVAADMHKVHLMCLLSLGMRQNEELNDLTLSGIVMSVVPSKLATVVGTGGGSAAIERRVESLLVWYKKAFSLEHVNHCTDIRLVLASSLCKHLVDEKVTDARVWVMLFVCILRTIGLCTRLVLSFQAMPFKGSQEGDGSGPNKQHKNKGSSSKESATKASSSGTKSKSKDNPKSTKPTTKPTPSIKGKQAVKSSSSTQVKGQRLSRRASSAEAKKHLREKEEEESDDEEEEREEGERKEKKNVKEKRAVRNSSVKPKQQANKENFPDSEEEFEETSTYFTSPRHLRKDLKISSNRKMLSSSSDDGDDSQTGQRSSRIGHDFWLEIYFPDKKKWICFDCFKGQFGKPYSLENSATQPLTYVVGFKNDGGVKDVTPRYAKQWLSHTRKLRIDQEWWEWTLAPYNTTPHHDNMLEDDEIKGQLLVRPMPTSIGEFKSHPLYALRRHLLKFEAIYPDSAIPVGYVRQEPVYARECVRVLHSRDNWLKEGRMVRIGEEPYKMVKSRPKWGKPKENPDELDLELYGEWQTEKYIPPPAVNGKIPKNEYGNVELFQPWMLPVGTVQLKVNGLQRVAKKLDIDVAQAMVGWDYHGGRSHPMFDGFIVCEEHADTLMAAWQEDQEIQQQRETERREKRVYGNWKLLIKGLLIKMRLQKKFLQNDPNLETKSDKLARRVEELKKQQLEKERAMEEKFSTAEPATDLQQAWPRRQQDKINDEKFKGRCQKVKEAQRVLEKGGSSLKDAAKGLKEQGGVDVKEGRDVGVVKKTVNKTKELKQVGDKGKRGQRKEDLASSKSKSKGVVGRGGKNRKIVSGSEGESDAENNSSNDEVDCGSTKPRQKRATKKTSAKSSASATTRPKRRSVKAVKYYDSGEEIEKDFDDSDADGDFDVEKEKRKSSNEDDEESDEDFKAEQSKKLRLSAVKTAGVKRNEDIERYKVEEKKKIPEPDSHWLSEEDSSDDDEVDGSNLSHCKTNFEQVQVSKDVAVDAKDKISSNKVVDTGPKDKASAQNVLETDNKDKVSSQDSSDSDDDDDFVPVECEDTANILIRFDDKEDDEKDFVNDQTFTVGKDDRQSLENNVNRDNKKGPISNLSQEGGVRGKRKHEKEKEERNKEDAEESVLDNKQVSKGGRSKKAPAKSSVMEKSEVVASTYTRSRRLRK